MKHMKGIATWVTAFIFAVALIVVYKTFDNFSAIWSFVSRLMDIISPFVFGFGLAFLLYAPCSKFESLFKRTQKRFLTKHARGISIAIVYVLLLLLLSLLFSFALPAAFRGIMNFVSQLPGYLDTAYQTVMDFVDRFGQKFRLDIQRGCAREADGDPKQADRKRQGHHAGNAVRLYAEHPELYLVAVQRAARIHYLGIYARPAAKRWCAR